ncbi:hypothetical protein CHS0354_006225 [Potamilus streckersoni]|uniref:Uncharacterized protein n=1 Tax=Potamilus streckersoni TaxID=2493646 RepID=A0AAE0S420_9BIVA|nr:hypothetical protein CHS0354_006225 [Potamilus streckersoni]
MDLSTGSFMEWTVEIYFKALGDVSLDSSVKITPARTWKTSLILTNSAGGGSGIIQEQMKLKYAYYALVPVGKYYGTENRVHEKPPYQPYDGSLRQALRESALVRLKFYCYEYFVHSNLTTYNDAKRARIPKLLLNLELFVLDAVWFQTILLTYDQYVLPPIRRAKE